MHYVQHYTLTTTLLMQSMHIQKNISHLNILCYLKCRFWKDFKLFSCHVCLRLYLFENVFCWNLTGSNYYLFFSIKTAKETVACLGQEYLWFGTFFSF